MEVLGAVRNTQYSTGKNFQLNSYCIATVDDYHTITHDGSFLPLKVGDRIFAKIKDGKTLRKPFVRPSQDHQDIRNFLGQALGKYVDGVFRKLGMLAGGSDNVSKYMDDISLAYQLSDGTIELPNLDINESITQNLLIHWYKGRILRQLYLLGLRLGEILKAQRCGINPLKLYEVCLENPYSVPCIPLKSCDEIMTCLGKVPDDTQYYCGQVVRWVYEKMENGWSYVPDKILLRNFPRYREYLEELPKYAMRIDSEPLGVEETRVYYRNAHHDEVLVSNFILQALNKEPEELINTLPEQEQQELTLAPEQVEAVLGAVNSQISVINGPAGSGKSTVLTIVYKMLMTLGIHVEIASYTGKAVYRVCEMMGHQCASTIDYFIVKKRYRKDAAPKFAWLMIDEATMCSTGKFAELIEEYGDNFKVTFFGDANQLGPFGHGSIFEQMIKSGKVPVYSLATVHRVGEGSNILRNANLLIQHRAIMEGMVDFVGGGDYVEKLRSRDSVTTIIDDLKEMGFGPSKFKVLCPLRAPLEELNEYVQGLFRKDNEKRALHASGMKTITHNNKKWNLGDQVIVLENNYRYDLKNGQEGYIADITDDFLLVHFDFFDREVDIRFYFKPKPNDPDQLSIDIINLAYALTIHKSQGSEYPVVVFYVPPIKVPDGKSAFFNINSIYTGMTRAKDLLIITGDRKTFRKSINKFPPYRFERLAERLGYRPEEEEVFEDFCEDMEVEWME